MNKLFIIYFFITLIVIFGCKKKDSSPSGSNIPDAVKPSSETGKDVSCLTGITDDIHGYQCYTVGKNSEGVYVFIDCPSQFSCNMDQLYRGCYIFEDANHNFSQGYNSAFVRATMDNNFPSGDTYFKSVSTGIARRAVDVLEVDPNYVAAGIKALIDGGKITDFCYDAANYGIGKDLVSDDDFVDINPPTICSSSGRLEANSSYIEPKICFGGSFIVDNTTTFSPDASGRPLLVAINIQNFDEKSEYNYFALTVNKTTNEIYQATRIVKDNPQYIRSINYPNTPKNTSKTDLKAVALVMLPPNLTEVNLILAKYKGENALINVANGKPYDNVTLFEQLALNTYTLVSSQSYIGDNNAAVNVENPVKETSQFRVKVTTH
jgi:hypothetical protein